MASRLESAESLPIDRLVSEFDEWGGNLESMIAMTRIILQALPPSSNQEKVTNAFFQIIDSQIGCSGLTERDDGIIGEIKAAALRVLLADHNACEMFFHYHPSTIQSCVDRCVRRRLIELFSNHPLDPVISDQFKSENFPMISSSWLDNASIDDCLKVAESVVRSDPKFVLETIAQKGRGSTLFAKLCSDPIAQKKLIMSSIEINPSLVFALSVKEMIDFDISQQEWPGLLHSVLSEKNESDFKKIVGLTHFDQFQITLIQSFVEKFPDQSFSDLIHYFEPKEERNDLVVFCFQKAKNKKEIIKKMLDYCNSQLEKNFSSLTHEMKENENWTSELVKLLREAKKFEDFGLIIKELAASYPRLFLTLVYKKLIHIPSNPKVEGMIKEVLRIDHLMFYQILWADPSGFEATILPFFSETHRSLLATKIIEDLANLPIIWHPKEERFLEVLIKLKLNDYNQTKILKLFLEKTNLSETITTIRIFNKINFTNSSRLEITKLLLLKYKDSVADFAFVGFITFNESNPDQALELAKAIILHTKYFDISLLVSPSICPGRRSREVRKNHLYSPNPVRELARCIVHHPTPIIWLDLFPFLSDAEKLELKWKCVRASPVLIEQIDITTSGWLGEFALAAESLFNLGEEERKVLRSLIRSIVNLPTAAPSKIGAERLSEDARLELLLICAKYEPMLIAQSPFCDFLLKKGDLLTIANLFIGLPFVETIPYFKPLLQGSQSFEYAKACCEKDPLVINLIDSFEIEPSQVLEILISYVHKQGFDQLRIFDLKKISTLLTDNEHIKLIDFCLENNPEDTINSCVFNELSKHLNPKIILGAVHQYARISAETLPLVLIQKICEPATCDDKNRLELAMAFAQRHPARLIHSISYFRISKYLDLMKIIKKCYESTHHSVWPIFRDSVDRCPSEAWQQLDDQASFRQALKREMLAWVHEKNNELVQYFNYEIAQSMGLSKEEISSILLSCAQNDGPLTAQYFENLVWSFSPKALLSEEVIVRMVDTLSQTAPNHLAFVIISATSALSDAQKLDLARIAFLNDPKSLKFLTQWPLKEQDLSELIRIFRERFPEEFKQECFRLVNPQFTPSLGERIELALIASRNNPVLFQKSISKSGIPPSTITKQLLPVMARHTSQMMRGEEFLADCSEDEKDAILLMLYLTQSAFEFDLESAAILKRPLSRIDLCRLAVAILKTPNPRLDFFYYHGYSAIRAYLSEDTNFDLSKYPEKGDKLDFSLIKHLLIRFIGRVLSRHSLRNFVDNSDETVTIFNETIERICHIRNGPQAVRLLVNLAYFLTDDGIIALKILTQQSRKKPGERYGKPHTPLLAPMLLVAKWAGESQSAAVIEQICQVNKRLNSEPGMIKTHFKKEALLPSGLMQVLQETVCQLDSSQGLTPAEKTCLICCAMIQPSAHSSVICLGSIQSLLKSPSTICRLKGPFGQSMKDDLQRAVVELHLKEGLLPSVEGIEEKYFKHLFPLTITDGWHLLYKSLIASGRTDLVNYYRKILESVLKGTYQQERDQAESPHIRKLKRECPTLWQAWIAGTPTQSFSISSSPKTSICFADFVREKILDGHLRDSEQKELSEYLVSWAKGELTAEAGLERVKLFSMNSLVKLQTKIMMLCKESPLSSKELSNQILELRTLLTEVLEEQKVRFQYFWDDLEGLSNLLNRKDREVPDCVIENLGSCFGGMLESGTVVQGSCQSLYSQPGGYNIGLMGPISDPKIRMIRVVDPTNGQVIARAFLRLLWNETKKCPILHLDRVYYHGNGSNPSVNNLIHQYALAIAHRMDLEIVTADTKRGQSTTDEVRSYGGVSQCEYCDGVRGLTNGDYRISEKFNLI